MSNLIGQPDSESSGSGRLNRGALIALLGVLIAVAVAVAVLLALQSIVTGLSDLRETTMLAVGLGVVPIAVWAASLAGALVVRSSLLRMAHFWLAGLLLTMAVIGILSFFRPLDGVMAWFSLYGRATLGGQVGDVIIGNPDRLGTLRIFGLFLLAIAVALPMLTFDLGRLAAQGIMVSYLSAFMAIRSLASRRPQPDEVEPEPMPTPWDTAPTPTEATAYRPTETSWSESWRDTPTTTPDNGEAPAYEPSLSGLRSYFNSSYTEDSDVEDGAESGSHEYEPDYPTTPVSTPAPALTEMAMEDEIDTDDVPLFEPDSETVSTRLSPSWIESQLSGPRSNRFWEPEAEPPGGAGSVAVADRAQPIAPPATGPLAARNGAALMWKRPSIDILKVAPENSISETELKTTAETITRTLAEYSVEVEVSHIRPGPTVTMYGLEPGWVRRNKIVRQVDAEGKPLLDERGKQITKRVEEKTRVKVNSIMGLEKDLALALKTQAIRIETPVMGKSLVGLEVPNPTPSLVTLRSVMESREFQKMRKGSHLPIALGRGSGGEAVSFDLAKMPHLLVAGATGSGKSVCLNAIVSCLVMEKTPAEMRLLLVDPKRVELTPFNGLPHLMAPVIVETDTVVGYLKGLIREMFDRYRRMEEVGVRNIEAYNQRMPDRMPFLCVVVDELADLMMTAAFDVEQSLCRLAQLGRATGIHLIIATQRPSVDVVTGLIKANFPSRISFGVTSQVDSRTILDTSGADKLLGRGDMLFLPIDAGKPSRVQNVFIGDEESEGLVNFWKSTPWPAIRQIDLLGGEDEIEAESGAGDDDQNRDDMMDKAIELALTHRKLSTSLLQRRLRIGYPRAARLMDQLEEEGVVGPSDGSKSRDVTIGS